MPRTEVIRQLEDAKKREEAENYVKYLKTREDASVDEYQGIDDPIPNSYNSSEEAKNKDMKAIFHQQVRDNWLATLREMHDPNNEMNQYLQEHLQKKHTPFSLCEEILEKLQITPTSKILVVSAVEFVMLLIDKYGVDKNNIFFLDECDNDGTIDTIKRSMLTEVVELSDANVLTANKVKIMKFDVIVGNPPFTDGRMNGGENLYPKFYDMSVKLAPIVAMIMPSSHKNMKEKTHNARLAETAFELRHIPKEKFKGVDMPMWVVYHDATKPGIGSPAFLSQSHTKNNPIDWGRGKVDITKFAAALDSLGLPFPKTGGSVCDDGDTIPLYYKFDSGSHNIIVVNTPRQTVKTMPYRTGFMVLFPQRFEDTGWNAHHVVDCSVSDFAVASNCYTAHFNTMDEVERFLKFVKSEFFINEVCEKVRHGKQRQLNKTGLMNLVFDF